THEGDEDRRSRLLLSLGEGKKRRGRGGGGGRIPARPYRRERPVRPGRHQGGERHAGARDAGRDQGGQGARRHGACQKLAPFRPAGDGRGMETRLPDGRVRLTRESSRHAGTAAREGRSWAGGWEIAP